MISLNESETMDLYGGGTKTISSPSYDLFMKLYKLTYNFIRSIKW